MRDRHGSESRLDQALPLAAILMIVGGGVQVHAYVDPGPASMMLQLILGGVAGVLVAVRLSWSRIKESLFRSPRSKADEPASKHS